MKTSTAIAAFAASVCLSYALPRLVQGCPYCVSPFKPGTYTGDTKRVGNGVAYSWVTLDAKGKPASVGVTLTDTALEGLSQDSPQSLSDMERDMFMLMLPREAMKTAFDHISLDWNPHGHDPSGIYDKPHFDIHFYTVDLAARDRITAVGKDVAVCKKPVVGGFLPAGYIYAPGAEAPKMGAHWIDPKSPEFNGKSFTSTFIYGSYDGKVDFVEPMATRAFLQSDPNLDEPIPQPTAYAKSAYYPTRYTIHRDPVRHEVTIALEGLTWRVAPKAGAASLASKTTARKH